MGTNNKIRLGLVGVGGRGGRFKLPLNDHDHVEVVSVCDVIEESVEKAMEVFNVEDGYTDYHEMLWGIDLDAVFIGTPKEYHVSQSIAALERGLHVISEVPAGATFGECKDLVEAVEKSDRKYMMAENYAFSKKISLVRALVEAGLFGEIYYAEGERINEEKDKLERTKWRRTWRGEKNGITYPTHTTGPVLSWIPDDRIERLTCAGSGWHYNDSQGEPYGQEDTTVILAKTEQGRLLRFRQDILSKRPSGNLYQQYNFHLQGTKGCFESARSNSDINKIWLEEYEKSDTSDDYQWMELEKLEDEYLPESWSDLPEEAINTFREGADYMIMIQFIDSIIDDTTPPVDIHRAMDMTLPGILSEKAIKNTAEWVEVPDSRKW